MSDHSFTTEISPNIQSKPILTQPEAISSCRITWYLREETNAQLASTSFQVAEETDMSSYFMFDIQWISVHVDHENKKTWAHTPQSLHLLRSWFQRHNLLYLSLYENHTFKSLKQDQLLHLTFSWLPVQAAQRAGSGYRSGVCSQFLIAGGELFQKLQKLWQ